MRRHSTLKTLRGMVEKYEAQIEPLEVQIKTLTDEKTELQGRIDEIRSVLGYVEAEADDFVSVPQSGTFSKEIKSFMHRTLATHGPLHRSDLLRMAVDAGIHIGGEDKLNNMTAHLSKNKKLFVSDGRGNWDVVDPDESEERDDDNTDDQDAEGAMPHLQLVT